MQLTTWQFEEGRFPTSVLEGVVSIIDKYLVAPGPAVVGASAQSDAEATVFCIGLGGTRVVTDDDGSVGELDEVWHAVGRVVCIWCDEGRRGPSPAFVRRKANLDASALAASQEPSVAEFYQTSVAATAEDVYRCASIPEDAAAVVASYRCREAAKR